MKNSATEQTESRLRVSFVFSAPLTPNAVPEYLDVSSEFEAVQDGIRQASIREISEATSPHESNLLTSCTTEIQCSATDRTETQKPTSTNRHKLCSIECSNSCATSENLQSQVTLGCKVLHFVSVRDDAGQEPASFTFEDGVGLPHRITVDQLKDLIHEAVIHPPTTSATKTPIQLVIATGHGSDNVAKVFQSAGVENSIAIEWKDPIAALNNKQQQVIRQIYCSLLQGESIIDAADVRNHESICTIIVRSNSVTNPLSSLITGAQTKLQLSTCITTGRLDRLNEENRYLVVGRQQHVQTAYAMLTDHHTRGTLSSSPCVAIVGPVGIGKTTIALRVAKFALERKQFHQVHVLCCMTEHKYLSGYLDVALRFPYVDSRAAQWLHSIDAIGRVLDMPSLVTDALYAVQAATLDTVGTSCAAGSNNSEFLPPSDSFLAPIYLACDQYNSLASAASARHLQSSTVNCALKLIREHIELGQCHLLLLDGVEGLLTMNKCFASWLARLLVRVTQLSVLITSTIPLSSQHLTQTVHVGNLDESEVEKLMVRKNFSVDLKLYLQQILQRDPGFCSDGIEMNAEYLLEYIEYLEQRFVTAKESEVRTSLIYPGDTNMAVEFMKGSSYYPQVCEQLAAALAPETSNIDVEAMQLFWLRCLNDSPFNANRNTQELEWFEFCYTLSRQLAPISLAIPGRSIIEPLMLMIKTSTISPVPVEMRTAMEPLVKLNLFASQFWPWWKATSECLQRLGGASVLSSLNQTTGRWLLEGFVTGAMAVHLLSRWVQEPVMDQGVSSPAGLYLVRFSESQPGNLAISILRQNGTLLKVLVIVQDTGLCVWSGNSSPVSWK